MPSFSTGETYSFAEGNFWIWPLASGTTSGSGVAYCQDVSIRLVYGWHNDRLLSGQYFDLLTGQAATIQVNNLLADMYFYRLAAQTGAVNAKFEGIVTGGLSQSAQLILYSGVVDAINASQSTDQVFKGGLNAHANIWSGFGQ